MPPSDLPPIWDLATLTAILDRSLYLLNWFALFLAIFSTIAAGVYYISGALNEGNAKKAKTMLTVTYTGLAIILLARLILIGPVKVITGNTVNVPANRGQLPTAPK